MRVDERPIRKAKYTDSKVCGYVWTGPEIGSHAQEKASFEIVCRALFNFASVSKLWPICKRERPH